MSSVGKISLDLNVNSKKFDRQVDGIKSQTTKAFSTMSIAVGNIMASMVQKAIGSIGNFVKSSIDAGSDLTELENVVDSVFTTMSDKVDNFAKTALDTYGLTEKQSKKIVGTYGAMSKSFGYTEKQAYSMSTALAGLTGDVASFYNLDIDESYTKLKSVFTGETESLKELGVVMTQSALDQFALANGFGKTTAKMSEQEKVALRLAFVQDKLSVAQGDVVRTQDTWANQMRKLTGQIDSFKTAIGQGLINILSPVLRMINVIMAKLVQLANAFKSFTEMITGQKASGGGGPGAAMQEVADAADSAADSTGGVEDAANGAAKAAKKAQKSLMGFDEINKLQSQTDSGSDSGGGGAGGVDFGDIDFGNAVEEQEKKSNEAIDAVMKKVKELIGLFKDGFKAGLGKDFEASLKRTKKHLDGIKSSVKDIFTDPEVVGAADNWAKSVAYAAGQVTGSVVSIGQTIAENLIGGVDKYLDQSKDYIKQRIVGILDARAEVATIVGDLAETLAEIFEVFRSDDAKQVTADIIGIFSDGFLGVTELAARIGADLVNLVAQPIIDNKDKIKTALENTITPIKTIVSTLHQSVKDTFDKIFEVYDEKIKPMFQDLANGLSQIVGSVLDAYNTYLAPVLDALATKFSEVWTSNIQPMLNKLIEFIGKVASAIGKLWKGAIAPLISWIVSNVVPVIAPILQTIGSTVLSVFGAIADIISGILDVLGGLIDFIVGVFTGDWQLAWDGIKSIFSGVWEIIKGIFSGVWEAIKGIVTTALQAISGIIQTIFNVIVGIVKTVWNTIKNVFSTVLGAIKALVSGGFKGMAKVIETITNAICTVITDVWNGIKTVISTILNGIKTTVKTVWSGIKKAISTVLDGINTVVTDIWNGISDFISTIVDGISSGISTGFSAMKDAVSDSLGKIKTTVKKVFNDIWDFIKGIANNILGGIEKLVNGVIGGLNKMIGAFNKLKVDVPDWVPAIGGKSLGFNIPNIKTVSLPRLAEGGYVRANQPQPVIVGDNRTQGEIISPENKMYDVFIQALESFFGKLKDAGYGQKNSDEFGDLVVPIYLGDSLLDEVIVTAQQRRKLRSGGR